MKILDLNIEVCKYCYQYTGGRCWKHRVKNYVIAQPEVFKEEQEEDLEMQEAINQINYGKLLTPSLPLSTPTTSKGGGG